MQMIIINLLLVALLLLLIAEWIDIRGAQYYRRMQEDIVSTFDTYCDDLSYAWDAMERGENPFRPSPGYAKEN